MANDRPVGSDAPLRHDLASAMGLLLKTPAFMDALPCHLPGDAASQARLPDLEEKLRALARLS